MMTTLRVAAADNHDDGDGGGDNDASSATVDSALLSPRHFLASDVRSWVLV